MMDFKYHSMDNHRSVNHIDPKQWQVIVWKRARRAYRNMRFRGGIWRLWCRLTRKSCALMDFSTFQKKCQLDNPYALGIQAIPVNQIMGSVGCVEDFDAKFFPLHDKGVEKRWVGVAEQFLINESVPAIEVFQVGNRYFVKDGHHRVSAARALGIRFIEAQVYVVKILGDLPWVIAPFRALRSRQAEQVR